MEQVVLDEMLSVDTAAVSWDDIIGLEQAKQTLQESVIYPQQHPRLFTGLRSPAKGILLFGPPGTGKTLLAKAVASESGFRFFSVSAASLTSKWVGEGEKLVRALFQVARELQPAVVFLDEMDALLSKRKDGEHDASRRLKTEFMVQLDGATAGCCREGAGRGEDARVMVMGATNLPDELDDAVLRRLPKKVYVPLPEPRARAALINQLLPSGGEVASSLSDGERERVVVATAGYSCSDLTALCKEASMAPVRETLLRHKAGAGVGAGEGGAASGAMHPGSVRPVTFADFNDALRRVRPSVSPESLSHFSEWEKSHG